MPQSTLDALYDARTDYRAEIRRFQQLEGHCVGYVSAWIRCRAKGQQKKFWERYFNGDFVEDSGRGRVNRYQVNEKGAAKIGRLVDMETQAKPFDSAVTNAKPAPSKAVAVPPPDPLGLDFLDNLLTEIDEVKNAKPVWKGEGTFSKLVQAPDPEQWKRDYICCGRPGGKGPDKAVLTCAKSSNVWKVNNGAGVRDVVTDTGSEQTFGLLSAYGGGNHAIGYDRVTLETGMVAYFDPNVGEVTMSVKDFGAWICASWRLIAARKNYNYTELAVDRFHPA
ncbi:MAG TPA: hypothetical protein VGF55_13590 [Gemmataceae bacterium]|jgi:hypothetical protein